MRGHEEEGEAPGPAAGALDLLEIWHYIAENGSIEAAGRMGEALDAGIERLREMPGPGHRRDDVDDERYLFYTVGKYVIAYRYEDATLRVIRVVHGHRDFRALFG